MRYLNPITFVKKNDSHYGPDLGEYVEAEPTRTNTVANVTDIGTDRSAAIFGDIKQGAKVIRLMPLFVLPEWDYVVIDGNNYQLTTERVPSERYTLIVEEVVLSVN